MRAVVANDYQGIDGLRFDSVPIPTPGDRDIVVRVAATSLNPVDVKMLTGELRALFETPFPYIPGSDLAGDVIAVGAAVTQYRIGDRVGGLLHAGLATYARGSADSALMCAVPAGVEMATAAAAPVVGLAALGAIRAAGPLNGRVIGVIGGGGSVGRIVIQLARAAGARVIATGRPNEAHLLRDLGAETVIDFTSEPVLERLRESSEHGVDALIDLVDTGPGLAAASAAIRAGGRLISTLFGPPAVGNDISMEYVRMDADGAIPLATLYALLERNEVRIDIGKTFSFDESIDALRALRDGAVAGKIVVLQNT